MSSKFNFAPPNPFKALKKRFNPTTGNQKSCAKKVGTPPATPSAPPSPSPAHKTKVPQRVKAWFKTHIGPSAKTPKVAKAQKDLVETLTQQPLDLVGNPQYSTHLITLSQADLGGYSGQDYAAAMQTLPALPPVPTPEDYAQALAQVEQVEQQEAWARGDAMEAQHGPGTLAQYQAHLNHEPQVYVLDVPRQIEPALPAAVAITAPAQQMTPDEALRAALGQLRKAMYEEHETEVVFRYEGKNGHNDIYMAYMDWKTGDLTVQNEAASRKSPGKGSLSVHQQGDQLALNKLPLAKHPYPAQALKDSLEITERVLEGLSRRWAK